MGEIAIHITLPATRDGGIHPSWFRFQIHVGCLAERHRSSGSQPWPPSDFVLRHTGRYFAETGQPRMTGYYDSHMFGFINFLGILAAARFCRHYQPRIMRRCTFKTTT